MKEKDRKLHLSYNVCISDTLTPNHYLSIRWTYIKTPAVGVV